MFLFFDRKIIQFLSNAGRGKTWPHAGVLICSHLLGLFAQLSLKEKKHLIVKNKPLAFSKQPKICYARQHAKKVVSDSAGLVDFAIRLVNVVL